MPMAKPAFPTSPSQTCQQVSGGADAAPRAPAATPEEAAQQQWLDARIREQYQNAAEEPLPERLVALIRRLRIFRN